MAGLANLETRIRRLEDLLASNEARGKRLEEIQAIKRLKYKYFRTLDYKQWDEMAECFAEDATTSYHDGEYQQKGIYAIMKFLQRGLAQYHFFGFHQGHNPEIEITSNTTATGIWALHNYMIDTKENRGLLIGAFYYDEYVKANGEWKMKSTGYERIFEESWDRGDTPSLELVASMFASATESG